MSNFTWWWLLNQLESGDEVWRNGSLEHEIVHDVKIKFVYGLRTICQDVGFFTLSLSDIFPSHGQVHFVPELLWGRHLGDIYLTGFVRVLLPSRLWRSCRVGSRKSTTFISSWEFFTTRESLDLVTDLSWRELSPPMCQISKLYSSYVTSSLLYRKTGVFFLKDRCLL